MDDKDPVGYFAIGRIYMMQGEHDASIAALKIVPEAARRLAREQIMGQPVLSSWGKLLDYCRIALAHEKVERFHFREKLLI